MLKLTLMLPAVVSSFGQTAAFVVPPCPLAKRGLVVHGRPQQHQLERGVGTHTPLWNGATGDDGDKAKKVDRKWQRKRRPVRLGPDGLPIESVRAPRKERGDIKSRYGGTKPRQTATQGKALELGMTNPSRLRITGGSARGKRLDSPTVYLRPMMGKVKEALFSTLDSFGLFSSSKPVRVLDLFCGSGSVGLEALSRGASEGVFVDFAAECCEVTLRNAAWCGFEGRAKAVRARAEEALQYPERFGIGGPGRYFDLVTVTPPYEEVIYSDLIRDVMKSSVVTEDTLVVIEYPVELGTLPFNIGDGQMLGLRNRRYGRTVLAIYAVRPTGRTGPFLRPEDFPSAQVVMPTLEVQQDECSEEIEDDAEAI